jgi:L-ascorbate metabolism protein UlaG (beta-lactamase superfamily)
MTGTDSASAPLTVTKLGHSCVRFERADARLVIDPGVLSAADALDGASGVLVTHQHPDHLDQARLQAALEADPDLAVYAPAGVVELLGGPTDRVRSVQPGDRLVVAGFDVEVVGEWHAVVHPDIPRIPNNGYVIDGAVLHPGDAFIELGVETLLLPVAAPWLKLAEVIDYVRAVAPVTALPIHDGGASAFGLALIGRQLGPEGVGIGPTTYRPWTDGDQVTLG